MCVYMDVCLHVHGYVFACAWMCLHVHECICACVSTYMLYSLRACAYASQHIATLHTTTSLQYTPYTYTHTNTPINTPHTPTQTHHLG